MALGDPRLVEQVLEDWRAAPIHPRLQLMLGFIEKLTLEPSAVSPEDVVPLRRAGLSDDAIGDAIHVCALFNMYDRIADSLGFIVPDARSFEIGARSLLTRGYR